MPFFDKKVKFSLAFGQIIAQLSTDNALQLNFAHHYSFLTIHY